jgi:hypothetical protein
MVYIRYHHIRLIIKKEKKNLSLKIINTIAYITGLLACLGISLVGNFQVIKLIFNYLI